MRKITMLALTVVSLSFIFGCGNKVETDPQKLIIGSWVNPYTYESTGEKKGFKFEEGGKCSAINIPSLELETWEIKENCLIIKGIDINSETGERSEYNTSEPIDLLNSDTLRVVAIENPKSCFVYINTNVIDKKD